MLKIIALLVSLFAHLAGGIAPAIKPDGPLQAARASATSQPPLRPIGPQPQTLDGDGTGCLDPDGRIVPCLPHFP